jgi:two-component system response regulator DevR
MALRVAVVDDHEMVRRGLRVLLEAEADLRVVGEAATAAEAVERFPALAPDVAVVDVRLPDRSGVELCRELRSSLPGLACLMVTSFSDDEALLDAVLAGAAGFLGKDVRAGELVAAVRSVAAGRSIVDPALLRLAREKLRHEAAEASAAVELTPRERRILGLIAEGRTNREIGAELYLAEKTVKNCFSYLFAKLGVHRRAEAAALAARLELDRRRRGRPGPGPEAPPRR